MTSSINIHFHVNSVLFLLFSNFSPFHLSLFQMLDLNAVQPKTRLHFFKTFPWVHSYFFLKKNQVHVSSFPFVFFIVSPKAVDPKSFSGDPIHIVFPLHLFYDHHSHVFICVSVLLEVVGRFRAVLPSQICSVPNEPVHDSILRLAHINHFLTFLIPHSINCSQCSAVQHSLDLLPFPSFVHYLPCLNHKFT